MKIIIADISGFCFGVKRAYQLSSQYFGENFQTFGPLIHNPQILEKISKNGGKIAHNIEEISSDTVVIRAHGISKKNLQKIAKKNVKIEDATCPFVKKLHAEAEKFSKEGYQLIIVGQKNHPEIKAITEDNPQAIVVFDEKEAFRVGFYPRIAVISQTTEKEEKVLKIVEILKEKSAEIVFSNTICQDVRMRQKAAEKLAKEVELVLVLGGKESSNTNKIAEICEKYAKTYHIENENELQNKWFQNIETVGVITGASTPEEALKSLLGKLENLCDN